MAIKTIDMQLMRYINLFGKVCKVSTTNCFVYNHVIVFAVPRTEVFRAIGKKGANMKKLGEILRKKIKVIEMPTGEDKQEQMEKFVTAVVEPIGFNKIEAKDGVVSISAGRQSKAALIGRGRAREEELGDIMKRFFHIQKLRIV